jgi:hypothetical protein
MGRFSDAVGQWLHPTPPAKLDPALLIPTDPLVLDEIIRQAELRMQAQLQLAVAADARSGLVARVQGAASAALVAVAAQTGPASLAFAPAIAAAVVLGAGTVLAAVASRPVSFGYPGAHPGDWLEDIKQGTSLLQARAETAALLDKYLRLNETVMTNNNRWATWSIICLMAAPVASGAMLSEPARSLIFGKAPVALAHAGSSTPPCPPPAHP